MSVSDEVVSWVKVAAHAASELKASSVAAIDVSELLPITEAFLIVSAASERQVRAIVNQIERTLHETGVERRGREGISGEARWVLLDYGDLIVHVFLDEDHELYALEKLWGDQPSIDVSDVLVPDSDLVPEEDTTADLRGFFGFSTEESE
ncbi:MAG: ribosome silencing factor [Actinomycetaceae bacterium]|nr:ribosome silencing factor [Actinomycetaceae bacterium]MDY6083296.1 ribosome silencing factor [Actinomycetaceae bacterium]